MAGWIARGVLGPVHYLAAVMGEVAVLVRFRLFMQEKGSSEGGGSAQFLNCCQF